MAGSSSITADFDTTVEPILVGIYGTVTQGWIGKIASIAIWNESISAEKIAKHYRSSLTPKQNIFAAMWSDGDVLWDSMLTAALGDMGMFYFDEENNFIYDQSFNYYNDRYPQHSTVQVELDESTNIVDAQQVVDLLVNKVIVKIYPTSSRSAKTEELWSGPDNESLAATTLAADLLGVTSGVGSYLEYNSTVDQFGIRQPIFQDSGYVKINNEIIKYDSKDDYKLLRGCAVDDGGKRHYPSRDAEGR